MTAPDSWALSAGSRLSRSRNSATDDRLAVLSKHRLALVDFGLDILDLGLHQRLVRRDLRRDRDALLLEQDRGVRVGEAQLEVVVLGLLFANAPLAVGL